MQIKKSLSIILLSILFSLVTAPQVFAVCECLDPENLTKTFAGGDGSSGNPYVICNADQLNNVRTSLASSYVVKSDIDLSTYTNWEPIGNNTTPFAGALNGQNFVISNLKIDRSTTDYVGLFGYTASGSVIQNVKLDNVNVKGYRYVGALIGYNNGNISIASSAGVVTGSAACGGLIGLSDIGILVKLSSVCSVTASSQVAGGLIGLLNGGSLSDSYARGPLTCAVTVGGLIGRGSVGTIANTYSTGLISTAIVNRGGLVGQKLTACSITSSYWDTQTSGITTSAGGTGKTTAEMKQQTTFTGWDFTNIWSINETVDYPHLLSESLTGECVGYCGDGIVSGEEQCEQDTDCGEGYGCTNCECVIVTLVSLSSFEATATNKQIILTWTTESEIDNAGFNIYRSEAKDGTYTKLNTSLIPAAGSATQGAAYDFSDNTVQNRKTYFYKLEDIDLNGTATMHGPVSATPRVVITRS
jgi:hypothetical protein